MKFVVMVLCDLMMMEYVIWKFVAVVAEEKAVVAADVSAVAETLE